MRTRKELLKKRREIKAHIDQMVEEDKAFHAKTHHTDAELAGRLTSTLNFVQAPAKLEMLDWILNPDKPKKTNKRVCKK